MFFNFVFDLPFWLGGIMFIVGIIVLSATPKIVTWNMALLGWLHGNFLNFINQISGDQLALPNQTILWKAARYAYWFVILVAGGLIAACGLTILLKPYKV